VHGANRPFSRHTADPLTTLGQKGGAAEKFSTTSHISGQVVPNVKVVAARGGQEGGHSRHHFKKEAVKEETASVCWNRFYNRRCEKSCRSVIRSD